MRAVTWHGKRDVRVETVPDPTIQEPTDAIIRVTSSRPVRLRPAPLRGARARSWTEGDILGHEPMGIVEAVGPEVGRPRGGRPRRRAVQHLLRPLLHVRPAALTRSARRRRSPSTARARRCSATPSSTARCPARRPSSCGCPRRSSGPIKVPEGPPDERFLYLSDVLPTAWQAVEYAAVPDGGTLAVFGLGPIGQMACRIALHRGAGQVIGIDLVPGAARARRPLRRRDDRRPRPTTTSPARSASGPTAAGPDSVIDAVGMEAHGAPLGEARADARRPPARRRRAAR